MMYRFASLALVGVLGLLWSSSLAAQDDYRGFPAERVRLQRTDSHVPDPLYPQNRVILRKVNLVPAGGTGMQFTGEIVTDFEADRIPAGEDLPRGQLEGLKVRIDLYHYKTVLERRADGTVKPPSVSIKNHGMVVSGQSETVEIDGNFGPFGHATFELPALDKPLAPGLYKLVAAVHFRSQEADLRESIKWCSGLYGEESEVVTRDGKSEVVWRPVMGDDERHDSWYDELINRIRKIEDEAHVWIGATKKDGKYELVTPQGASDRNPTNHLVWTLHHGMVEQVVAFEDQLDNVDEYVEKDLQTKLAVEGATEEMKERWRDEAEREKRRIRRDNADLITKYGGRTTNDEQRMLSQAKAARKVILEQICEYQEYLTYKYWVLADGVLSYRGWHSVNAPAHLAYEAIQSQDARAAKIKRIEALDAARDAEGGLGAKWDKREEAWKYQPPGVRKSAFDYLRTKEETDEYDPENFTKELSGEDKLILDIAEWVKFRNEFMAEYVELTDKLFDELTTTNLYANQTWPEALSEARGARDEVVTLCYSWEFYIRQEAMGESRETITESWEDQAQQNPTLRLERFYGSAAYAPGTVYSRFKGHVGAVKKQVKLATFGQRYRAAIDAGAEGVDLPGSRPPTAPAEVD